MCQPETAATRQSGIGSIGAYAVTICDRRTMAGPVTVIFKIVEIAMPLFLQTKIYVLWKVNLSMKCCDRDLANIIKYENK